MIKQNALSEVEDVPNSSRSGFDIKNIVVLVPLAVITVFCLSFVEMKAVKTQNSAKQEAAESVQNPEVEALPLITQPALPTLKAADETMTSEPVAEPNSKSTGESRKADKVGPSSIHSGNAIQPNFGNSGKKIEDDLQATRRTIRLEEADF